MAISNSSIFQPDLFSQTIDIEKYEPFILLIVQKRVLWHKISQCLSNVNGPHKALIQSFILKILIAVLFVISMYSEHFQNNLTQSKIWEAFAGVQSADTQYMKNLRREEFALCLKGESCALPEHSRKHLLHKSYMALTLQVLDPSLQTSAEMSLISTMKLGERVIYKYQYINHIHHQLTALNCILNSSGRQVSLSRINARSLYLTLITEQSQLGLKKYDS